jgi:hypothetical protein
MRHMIPDQVLFVRLPITPQTPHEAPIIGQNRVAVKLAFPSLETPIWSPGYTALSLHIESVPPSRLAS